ncbi:7TM diverse intracellular signaling domain-containing protein [Meridianimaribacter flavus]
MKFILLFCLLSIGLYAQENAYNLKESSNKLYNFAEFTATDKPELSIEEVLNSNLEFTPLASDNHSIGFTSQSFWTRFKLFNPDSESKTYYLQTARPITDIADLYQISKNGIEKFSSGDQIPFNERQVEHRETIFKITLPANTTQQFYLHLASDGETINIPLDIYSEFDFWVMNYKQQLFLGLFYGLLFLAGVIYLFFYTSLKEKTFLYYGLYVFSIALMQGALDGLIFQYIFLNGGFINSRAVMIAALASNFFLLKYCEYFLKVKQRTPKIHSVFKGIYIFIAALFVMVFLSEKTLELTYPIANLNGLISLVFILATLFIIRYKKIKIDPYFSIGIFFLVIGLLGFVMNNLSLLPNNFYTLNSAKFGSGFEVIFLSLSMTNLIKRLRMEKEKSQVLALKKSEEISKLKTYFMSNMSHELRTPINAIMGIAENQLETNKSNTSRKNFEIIKNASLSLLSSVNDILDFEKIEKKELKLRSEEFNPSVVLNQISSNWKLEAEKKGLTYAFEMDYNIPTRVKGDKERFVQIINNILNNAIKFTIKGGVHLKLSCTQQPNDLSRFSFVVSDTGVGMSDDMKGNMFDSFNQMKHDNKRQFGGIGLGMTIAKYLVELFNGTISIESSEGKGTKVFVELPLEVISKPKEESFLNVSQKDPLKVLVVEDNVINQMIMRKLLGSSEHINFAVAQNGQEALEILKKDVYDVVLMDLQMPVMDGYEATKIIRSGTLGQVIGEIPIIAVTADAMQETRQRVLDIGMNDYMTKPVNKDLLMEKINYCCKPKLQIA